MATEEESKYLERKRFAIEYLKTNDVPNCFQKLLNNILEEPPDDIFGFMVNFFAFCVVIKGGT